MRQFQVPQFITVEDTIVGPLTIKQFAYIGIGVLVIGVLYKLLPGTIFFLIAPIIGGVVGSLAFLKINDQPLPKILRHGISDRKSTRLNSSHSSISYAVFCLKKQQTHPNERIPKAENKDSKNNLE